MHNISLLRGVMLAAVMLPLCPPPASADVSPRQWLLKQVRVGEAAHDDLLVRQSLYRLELMDPDNPDVIAAGLRLALRQGNLALAGRQLDKLQRLAPDSAITRQARLNISLTTPTVQQQLQQARLLATAGRLPEAKALYDALFQGRPPTVDLAVEYWRLTARLPGQQSLAIDRLQQLDGEFPGNADLRILLAKLLFAQHRDDEGYALLRQLADSPAGRGDAADIWMRNIKAMPVGDASIDALRQFIAVFGDGPPVREAEKELARQQSLAADPRYQARVKGLAAVEGGASARAVAPLKQALQLAPDDAEVLGALGLAYARNGQREQAIALFEQAQKDDQNGFHGDKWRSLIASNRYWLLLDRADSALKAHNLPLAQQQYRQALQIDSGRSQAWVGLGQVATARSDDAAAEGYFLRALRIESDNGGAIRGLNGIYQRRSPQKALAFLTGLPPAQRAAMHDNIIDLQIELWSARGDEHAARQQWPQAADDYRRAQRLAPDRVWLTYRLGKALQNGGRMAEADAVFAALAARRPDDGEQVYAYALYLSSSGRPDRALAHLDTLPSARWSRGMGELAARLRLQARQDRASRLRAQGDETAAIAWLSAPPVDNGSRLMLADWALARRDYAGALAGYRQVSTAEPGNRDAQLGEIEALLGLGQKEQARQRLVAVTASPAAGQNDSFNTQRRIAVLWTDVGEPRQGLALLSRLKPAARRQGPSQADALVFRDSARLEQRFNQPGAAREDYRQAMADSGITAALPTDNDDYTRLTRYQRDDDWLKRGIRSDAATLARQQEVNVTLAHDYSSSSGTGGVSDLTSHDTMLQVDLPSWDGRAFFRTDSIEMNAGSFATRQGTYDNIFGTCAGVSTGCHTDRGQSASGTSLAAGWQDDRWQGDLGTTPLGFDVVDWVGGLSYSNDWRNIGWTATASRRPISTSLLAFGGARDPVSGMTWGGVRATGVTLSASYDRGEADGLWGNAGLQRLTGENVADNQRVRLMAGYYHKFINDDDRRMTAGLNSMWWHYQKDLSDYALGQGGYYSPQRYVSLSVPVNYRQRSDNWSWQLGGTVGWSQAKTRDGLRYPLQELIPDDNSDKADIEQGGTSSGIGYTLLAMVERRLDSHWTLGAGIDIQQAKDYTPSHGFIYLRYALAGWQGDLDSPPQPLTPYADFR
ncbi:cellulose synthase complex outer membrane protein BcsC [Sodalis sp. dw_96]|uniref:cellulose synthase complex outer membrane protein BcsC n=1 Tax=Sodalis sp. dw_96 TaxID=2719794 RepID=UPI001BD33447|nr:cellulose synthase complex outer membrane protein BcsC [Sodalis sp. dw_96]